MTAPDVSLPLMPGLRYPSVEAELEAQREARAADDRTCMVCDKKPPPWFGWWYVSMDDPDGDPRVHGYVCSATCVRGAAAVMNRAWAAALRADQ